MPRFYTEISKEDFLEKIKNLLVTDDEDDDDIFMKGAEEEINGDLMIADILQRITKKI